jgi:hypothetical protein
MVQVVLILAGGILMSFVFGLFGNLPPTPSWLEGVATGAINLFEFATYTLSWLIGAHLFFGTLALIVVVMTWEPVYHLILWVLRKIPILGIK